MLRDMTEQEKEVTFQQLLTTIENTDVAVFCFTDYWTFDGYIQFINYLQRKNILCSKTIFPGMRVGPVRTDPAGIGVRKAKKRGESID